MLFYPCTLVYKNYVPLKLEEGMYFFTGDSIRQIDKVPHDQEQFIKDNGYPVEFYIIDEGNPNLNDGQVLVEPEEIGWFDEGDHSDDLEDINIDHLNLILQNDGDILLQMEEVVLDDDECQEDCEEYYPLFINDKVVIRLLFDDPTDEEEDEEWEEYPDFQSDEI